MSETANNNVRSSRRKPLKTTRILAEIDDEMETSGTDTYYVSDSATGLPTTLLSDQHDADTGRDVRSESPQRTEAVVNDGCNLSANVDIPPVTAVTCSSLSDDVSGFTSKQTSCGRGRPRRSQSVTDSVGDTSPLLAIDEYNIGPVLEKLLAMMQSMTMLLTALKNDLRHSYVPEVVAKKRDAATTQLWRAFVAYQKSFTEIEQFACASKTAGTVKKPVQLQSEVSQVRRPTAAQTNRRMCESEVIELSESESDDDVACKRPRCDETEQSVSSAAVIASSDDLSRPASAVASLDAPSDTSTSCVCIEPATELSEQSDSIATD